MINLGDKNWGVKDSGLLAYKQVGSKYFNKDFDFTRASDATYIDKNGVLQTQSLYNLFPYSQDLNSNTLSRGSVSDADILSPFNNNEKSLFIPDTINNFHYLRFPALTRNAFVHTISVFLKSDGSDAFNFVLVNVSAGNSDGNAGVIFNVKDAEKVGFFTHDYDVQIDDFGNGWHRYSFQFTTSSISVLVDCNVLPSNSATSYSGNGTNGVYIYGAQLVEGTEPLDYQYTNGRVGIPRIDFSDGVGSLLLEPQRTNLVTYSEQLNLWGGFNVTITSNTSQSPDGYQNADNVNITATNGFWRRNPLIFANSTSYAASVFVKKSATTGTKTFRFYYNSNAVAPNNGGWSCVVDLTNITATTTPNGTPVTGRPTILGTNVVDYGNDWYRVEVAFTTGSSAANSISEIGFLANGVVVDFDAYGAQLEEGSYATSYIKSNSGSATTRTADVANNCGTEQDFNSEEGVLYAEIAALADDATRRYITISNGSDSYIRLTYTDASNQLEARYYVNGTFQCVFLYTITDTTQFTKAAFKYKENDFALWVNGVEVASDTSGSVNPPNTFNRLDFINYNNVLPFYGKVRSVKYFPTALGDSKLITLTGGDGSLYGLFNSFEARVLADGGTIESQDCIINELKELL